MPTKNTGLDKEENHIHTTYGNRTRVRVCGFLVKDDRFLMVGHAMAGPEKFFWAPPGGGVNFGEHLEDALVREFREETGLSVVVGRMLFLHEFIELPLHAVEIFFEIKAFDGTLVKGSDPEHAVHQQLIDQVAFLSLDELHALPAGSAHEVMSRLHAVADIYELYGVTGRQ
ncbi:hypothetical protein DYBT9275_02058 [Dyadobacter sp. CECT 9275]|uniref:Nudix hydrolase domain-containing protein n=1 Tax=Dyadobacter helix TaxID=2822344 RepID=A0A916NBZ7_9BACT|nr:NUDIX hydrolase [Dyadobacter sp. CECT 9275]CAG4998689.1 hypothetical protein DYBT9275_02058 [Dyadobacter sp. CECT 9275]